MRSMPSRSPPCNVRFDIDQLTSPGSFKSFAAFENESSHTSRSRSVSVHDSIAMCIALQRAVGGRVVLVLCHLNATLGRCVGKAVSLFLRMGKTRLRFLLSGSLPGGPKANKTKECG